MFNGNDRIRQKIGGRNAQKNSRNFLLTNTEYCAKMGKETITDRDGMKKPFPEYKIERIGKKENGKKGMVAV